MNKLLLFLALLAQSSYSFAVGECYQTFFLDKDLAHISMGWLNIGEFAPDGMINFYDNRSLKGNPVIKAGKDGVLVKGVKQCSWTKDGTKDGKLIIPKPKGVYDISSWLGSVVIGTYNFPELCLPSVFNCGGFFMMVQSFKDGIVEVDLDGKSYFTKFEYAPGKKFGLYMPSENSEMLRKKSLLDKMMSEPLYKKFSKDLNECLVSKSPERCIDKFVLKDAQVHITDDITEWIFAKAPKDKVAIEVRTFWAKKFIANQDGEIRFGYCGSRIIRDSKTGQWAFKEVGTACHSDKIDGGYL